MNGSLLGRASVLLLGLWPLQVAAAPAAAPPPSAFAERASFFDPVLSPGGRRIAARLHDTDDSLCVLEVAALEKGCARRVKLAGLGVASIRWANDRQLLIGVPRIVNGFRSMRYLVQDADTGSVHPLESRAIGLRGEDILWIAPDGESLLISADFSSVPTPQVERIDLTTGAAVEIEKPQHSIVKWFADTAGRVRAGIGTDGVKVSIWYRDDAASPLRKVRIEQRSQLGRDDDDRVIETIRFDGPDGAPLVITNGPTGRFAVYRYDAARDRIGDAVFEHPEVDVTGFRLAPGGVQIAGVAYEDDRLRVKWLLPQEQALQATVDKVFPDTENEILGESRDGGLALIGVESPEKPALYYLFDRGRRRMEELLPGFRALSGVKLSPSTPFRYTARDGLSIPSYLTLPQGRSARPLPLIVMPHGGPFERDHWGYDPYVQFLASRGYAVLQPEFRGSTGYGRAFVEKGYGQIGRAMQDDLDDGVAALAKAGVIDPERVCIAGTSYGGYAALWAAARGTGHYRCAISLAGLSDLKAMRGYNVGLFSAKRYHEDWNKHFAGEDKIDLGTVSPIQQAQKIHIPVLIGHGEQDIVVPSEQSHRLVAALRSHGATVESVFYDNEQHGLSHAENITDFLRRTELFLSKYNPA